MKSLKTCYCTAPHLHCGTDILIGHLTFGSTFTRNRGCGVEIRIWNFGRLIRIQWIAQYTLIQVHLTNEEVLLTPFESRLESISCSSVVAPSSEWHWWQCMMLKFTDYQTHYLANLTDLSYIHYTYRKYRLYMDFLPMPTSLKTSYLLFQTNISTEYPCRKLSSKEN